MDRAAVSSSHSARIARARVAAVLVATTAVPVLAAVGAGVAFAPAGRPIDRYGALLAGGVAAVASAAVLARLRPSTGPAGTAAQRTGHVSGESRPPVVPTVPEPGATVRICSHFTPGGGYVRHRGTLLWAAPADGPATAFTPGTAGLVCATTRKDGGALLTVRASPSRADGVGR